MSDKRVTVWVQRFKDRKYLMLQWIDPDTGKRKSVSAETDDEKAAEQKRADKEYELNHGLHQEPSKMTWERFREVFEAEFLPSKRENTRRNYRVALDLFESLVRPQKIGKVDGRTVSAFSAALHKQPGYHGRKTMEPSTIKVRLQFLHTVLAWAVEKKYLVKMPKFSSIKVPKKKPQPVPSETVERLLSKAPDPHTRAFLLCAWLAGLRLNESLALEWEQADKAPYLDPDRHRIFFPAEAVKGGEDQWVPLDPELWEALDALPRLGPKVFYFDAIDGRGVRKVCDITVSSRIRKIARAAGVKLTYKSLRRGFGCRYAGKVPAQVLQKLMRHSNIRITMDYYANVDDAVMDAVIGGKRNTSRNRRPPEDQCQPEQNNVKPCGEKDSRQ